VRLSAVRVLPADNPDLLVADLASVLRDPTRAVRVAAAARLAHLPTDKLTQGQHQAFIKAMIEFREAQSLQLDHAGGHMAFASLDRQHNRIEQAIEHLTAAIKLEPYLAGPRAELASLMQEHRGDEKEIRRLRAEEADLWERDSKLVPDNAHILYRLGLLRYTLDEYDRAAAALEQACEKAPKNADYRMALALLQEKRYELTGDEAQFNAAVASLHKLQELDRKNPAAQQILTRLVTTRQAKEAVPQKPPE
jgi:tetratricopeptide (TPR) repeat protein